MSKKFVYIAATFDTKIVEAEYIKGLVTATNTPVITVDLTTQLGYSANNTDFLPADIAKYHPDGPAAVFLPDRGQAIAAMSLAFSHFIHSRNDIAGLLGLGGSGGTALISPAMQTLPIGIPKIMVSTMASGDIKNYVGSSDISMLYSVTDIAGLNRISRQILANAAHSMAGAVKFNAPDLAQDKPAVGVTMFGVTTPCVKAITSQLSSQYDCLVFHATGTGGHAMEKLASSQLLSGIIDITTTEICDLLFGGVLACKPTRLDVVAQTAIPYVGSCGALDMINFGHPDTVPTHYKDRLFYQYNPQVTLMRTTPEENYQLGEWIGKKLNQCEGEVRFLLPEGGFSALDAQSGLFCSLESNQALFDALQQTVQQTAKRKLIAVPYHINDPAFAKEVVKQFSAIYVTS